MNTRLTRRQFNARCAALGLALPALDALAAPAHTVKLAGVSLPAIGQGAWHLGQGRHPEAVEQQALDEGLMLGMSLIDTSGNYGGGRSEQFLSRVLAGDRKRIFLVSKVEADEVAGDGIPRACDASLARLKTGYLDLYLLHAPVPVAQFAGVVDEFEKLQAAGKIRAWGVSNFDTDQMQALFQVPGGSHCATNQVYYNLRGRGIESTLLPWCAQHDLPVMAYSPLGGDHKLLINEPVLKKIGADHRVSAAAVALAWAVRSGRVLAIPESGSPAHTRENAAALSLTLTPQDLAAIDAAYPPPGLLHKLREFLG